MKSVKQLISNAAMNEAYQYMAKDPMKNLPKLIDWAEKINKTEIHKNTLQMFRDIAETRPATGISLSSGISASSIRLPRKIFDNL